MVKTKEAVALIERIKELLAEKKAENVVALDLRRVSETLDYFVVASATSTYNYYLCSCFYFIYSNFTPGLFLLQPFIAY